MRSIWPFFGRSRLRRHPLGALELLGGRLFRPSKSTDSRAPTDRFPRLVYAERYLRTDSLRLELSNFRPGPNNTRLQAKERTKNTAIAERLKPMRRAKGHHQHQTPTNYVEKRNPAYAQNDQRRTQTNTKREEKKNNSKRQPTLRRTTPPPR